MSIIRVALIVLSAYAGSVLASSQYLELPDLSQVVPNSVGLANGLFVS
jgi:hypothetical protein